MRSDYIKIEQTEERYQHYQHILLMILLWRFILKELGYFSMRIIYF